MYCESCGNLVPDGQAFCSNCGAAVAQAAPAAQPAPAPMAAAPVAAPAPAPAPAPAKSNGIAAALKGKSKIIIIAAAAVVVIAVLAVLLTTVFAGGYKKQIKKMVSLMNSREKDYNEYVKLSAPSFDVKAQDEIKELAKKYGDKDEYEDTMGYLDEIMEDVYDGFEDDYGKNWKVSYKITDVDEISNKDLKAYKESLKDTAESYKSQADYYEEDAYFYGEELSKKEAKEVKTVYQELAKKYKSAEVKKGYEVELELKIKGKDDEDEDEVTIKVYKINGQWILGDGLFW